MISPYFMAFMKGEINIMKTVVTKEEFIKEINPIYLKHAKKLKPILKYRCIPLINDEKVNETFIKTEVYLCNSTLICNNTSDSKHFNSTQYNKFITSPIIKSSYSMGDYEFNLNNIWDKYFMALQMCTEELISNDKITVEMVYDTLSTHHVDSVFGTMDYREVYSENDMTKEELFKYQKSSMEILFNHVYKAIVKANKDFESKLISIYNADFDGDCIDIPSLLKLFADECERKISS